MVRELAAQVFVVHLVFKAWTRCEIHMRRFALFSAKYTG
jgi:hypothetical protein